MEARVRTKEEILNRIWDYHAINFAVTDDEDRGGIRVLGATMALVAYLDPEQVSNIQVRRGGRLYQLFPEVQNELLWNCVRRELDESVVADHLRQVVRIYNSLRRDGGETPSFQVTAEVYGTIHELVWLLNLDEEMSSELEQAMPTARDWGVYTPLLMSVLLKLRKRAREVQ